jgi:predicted ABC-type ATPase
MNHHTKVGEEAAEYLKIHRKELIGRFASLSSHPPQEKPRTIFMSGAPGAGKTEFSKGLIRNNPDLTSAVRIDADEIKTWLPQYTGKNTSDVQGVSVLGLIRLFDYALRHKQSAIIDGTFSEYTYAKQDIERCLSLKYNRFPTIIYIYQEPRFAWEFTKIRALDEGREIPVEYFIDTYFKSIDVVNKIKEEFKEKVQVDFVVKNYLNQIEKTRFNIDRVDNHIDTRYSRDDLKSIL